MSAVSQAAVARATVLGGWYAFAMRGRLLLLTVLLVLGALVAALNWEAMSAPLRLELLVGVVEFALGWVVLLAALVPAVVLLLAGLLDQSRALRRVDALERQLDQARSAVERVRSAEIEALERSLDERFETVRAGFEGALHGSEARLEARFEAVESALGERLHDLRERVVLVRDELAADIAEAEDAIMRGRAAPSSAADAAHAADADDADDA